VALSAGLLAEQAGGAIEPSDQPLRLVMATARYLPFMGGVELHVDQVARRLAAQGVDVTILTTDPTGTLPPAEDVGGARVRRVRAWPARRDYYFAPRVYHEIAQGNWDVVHVQAYHTFVGPLAMLAAWRSRVPFVVTFHAGGHPSRLRHALRPIQLQVLRPLLARADRLVALAPFEIDHYSRRLRVPRSRFALIPNGSDLPRPTAAGLAARSPGLLASLGRLERYKGHHRVLAALPLVARQRPDARLWIAGSGPYRDSLRQLAGSLDVADRVDIHAVPPQERERFAEELARVGVVVLMSEFETQPIAALEALALGCRLIVADTPGLRALANDGLARRVPLDISPTELARAILEELDKPPLAEPPAMPTWDDCAEALLQLYDEISRNHPRPLLRPIPRSR
jgi:glycosyltransferase involved in cell wall biosynthesis